MSLDWTIGVGTLLQLLGMVGTVVWAVVKVLGRLDRIEEWMKEAPKKEDFVVVQMKLDQLWQWWSERIERRERGHEG